MEKIRIGIVGYGNLGRGVELAISQNEDFELVGVFTRRNPEQVKTKTGVKVYLSEEAVNMKDQIDVMLLCVGSAEDLPIQGPIYAKMFNTIDSFDTHARIPEYLESMNQAANQAGHLSISCVGWDPGLFSLNRCILESVLPEGNTYTFYGRGLSQGHSEAVRKIQGVKNAVQYTIPYEEAVERVRKGENPQFQNVGETMWRECFVVVEDGVNQKGIEEEIKTMPYYFAPYHTQVHFISEEEFYQNHIMMPHGGFVLRSGTTGKKTKQVAEFSLKLESNPEFTSSVLLAYARACYRLAKKGEMGVRTTLDIAPALLSKKSQEELRKGTI